MAWRKRKVCNEKRVTIDEEVGKLYNVRFITKTKHLTWMVNMVLVQKANNRWFMCVDFAVMNVACPKDPHLLPNINCLTSAIKGNNHVEDLKDVLHAARKYDMRLNPTKCSFGVHAGKFLSFMLTRRGIDANLDKRQVVITMRNPTNVKEVQQLTYYFVALSIFLSCACDKAFLFFYALKENERFE